MTRLRVSLAPLTIVALAFCLYSRVYRLYGDTLIQRNGTQPFLIVDLYGFNTHCGLGNLVFELLGSIALARKTGRQLIVRRRDYDRMRDEYGQLRNLMAEVKWDLPNELISFSRVFDFKSAACCSYNAAIQDVHEAVEQIVLVKLSYVQSFKYFDALELAEVRRLLAVDSTVIKATEEELLEPGKLSPEVYKICVHSRRRDFLREWGEQAPSMENFTLPAIRHVAEQSGVAKPLVVFMGDDLSWQGQVARQLTGLDKIVLPRAKSTASPVVDWQFAQRHCDAVLLTASSSTFGWWAAYLSKGQRVFYNSIYGKGAGFGGNLLPADFFPPHWKQLTLSGTGQIEQTPR